MSKRRRSRSGKRRAQQMARQSQAIRSTQSDRSTGSTRGTSSKEVDFRSEYQYVLSDLKRFAVLAVAMFATLVVLALVLG